MKKLLTAICCVSLAVTGYFITKGGGGTFDVPMPHGTLHAATIPFKEYSGQLPLDILLDQAKKIKQDTIVIHDTVIVTNTKYVRIPVPGHTTDTIYVPLSDLPELECVASVKNRSPGDREEYTPDEEVRPSPSIVILTVDGQIVYSSENDIHSGSSLQDSTSVSDGRQTP